MIRIDEENSIKLFVQDQHGQETRLDGHIVNDTYMSRKQAMVLLKNLADGLDNGQLNFNFNEVYFVHLCYDYLETWKVQSNDKVQVTETNMYREFKTEDSQIIFISNGHQNGVHVYWWGNFTDKLMCLILNRVMHRVIMQVNEI